MTAATLLLTRPVLNATALFAWAQGQGFGNPVKPAGMHVTIGYSRQPVDWDRIGLDEGELVIRGGPRTVEHLAMQATSLMFESGDLVARHAAILAAGASWDWPHFRPHITISYRAAAKDLTRVGPFREPIVLGPEQRSEIRSRV